MFLAYRAGDRASGFTGIAFTPDCPAAVWPAGDLLKAIYDQGTDMWVVTPAFWHSDGIVSLYIYFSHLSLSEIPAPRHSGGVDMYLSHSSREKRPCWRHSGGVDMYL